MIKANTAGFRFSDYKILEFFFCHLTEEEGGGDANVKIDFDPSGEYYLERGEFRLNIIVKGTAEIGGREVLKLHTSAIFTFEGGTAFEDIPDFFYKNSTAIFFPYIRAFISTVTLQSNGPLMVLSLMNLSNLEIPLKANIKILP